jgi:hypothetical protein
MTTKTRDLSDLLDANGDVKATHLDNAPTTTINNNANNRIITGSGSANTLEGETNITFDGTNLDLPDDKKIRLGTGNDIQLYHDGANSYFTGGNIGAFYIRGGTSGQGSLNLTDASGGYRFLVGNDGGATEIYHNATNELKLATTSNGVEVTGGVFSPSGSDLQLGTNGNVRMYMISNGDIFFSNTTEGAIGGGSTDGKMIDNADGARLRSSRASTSTREHLVFYNPNGGVGSITTNGSSTSYNTSSDYRLKENVVNITSATERLKQLSPKRFNFIADANKTVDGFLAHEVSDIVPEAITGTKDAVDADGNPVYQGIDQSKLVPLLTASLKEAVAKIEELETRLTALET